MFLDLAFKDPTEWAAAVAVVIGSTVLHELGHAIAATWEGDPTPRMRGRLTWDPRVHMGWTSIILACVLGISWGLTPVNPSMFRHRRWGDVLVSFAGPAVNLFLAIVAAAALAGASHADGVARWQWTFLSVALFRNLLLFLFNMIPVPPLDGFSVLSGAFDLGQLGASMRRMGSFGVIGAMLLVSFGVIPVWEWSHAAGIALCRAFGGDVS